MLRGHDTIKVESEGVYALDQGWPDFFAYGQNFIKILFLFFLKYDIIDVNFGYFSYINS